MAARRPVLGGGTLNPFGGGGIDFGSFNIVDRGNEAYLAFLKVETAWNAGLATNDDYLAALQVYANAQTPGSSDYVSAQARVVQTKYQVGRNILLDGIQNRTKTPADLVAYDKTSLTGLNANSGEYQQRLQLYRTSQAKLIADEEQKKVDLYQAGKLTTTALLAWYKDVLTGPIIDNNPDLVDSLTSRITELTSRVLDEKDNKAVSDFQNGKMTTADFIAYATSAKARYAAGTSQANDWTKRLSDARQQSGENNLLYRYNLAQQYAELQRFVKSNSGKAAGGTSTSTSTRVVLGADGHWHTVTSTKTKTHGPTANEIAAYKKLQIEIADAKSQMASIAHKAAGVGGFVTTQQAMTYYQHQLAGFAKGTDDWYRVQGKLDGLSSTLHQEQVYSREGIKITYPTGGGSHSSGSTGTAPGPGQHSVPSTGGAGGGGYSLNQFMHAIATQESGGRYTARNAGTGAYGKYQILPSNWSSWAQKAGLSGNAPQTPENQEKVATAAFARLAKSYHNDWSRVAAAWFAGVSGSADPNHWGPATQRYVNAIMSHMGTTVGAVRGGSVGSSSGGTTHVGGPPATYAAQPGHGAATASSHPAGAVHTGSGTSTATGHGPLAVITSAQMEGRRGATQVIGQHFTGFPSGLDSRAFEHFYSNYTAAFQNGDESFVDNSTGRPVAYFIGADPAERIVRMRQLDDLRIQMFDARAVAYQGTPSELTAANQRNSAVQDLAAHEYQIVDSGTGQNASSKINIQTNPLAAGIRLLDKTKKSIADNLKMADDAYARGDLTAAFTLYQEAQRLLQNNGATINLLKTYAAATSAKVAGIEHATGGITPEQALGAGKGGAFTSDLERLTAGGTELSSLFIGTESQKKFDELWSHLQKDSGGKVVWDDPNDPGAQLKMTDDSYFLVDENGKLSLNRQPPTWDSKTNSNQHEVPGTVKVQVKTSTGFVTAQAKWTVGQVGAFRDPNDPSKLIPLMGKIVRQFVNGKWVQFYENPTAPGSAAGWSDKPWIFTAPAGFTSKSDGKGGATYSFTGGSGGGPKSGKQASGDTYSLVFDPTSGTYIVTVSNPGGLFKAGVPEGTTFGTAGDASVTDLFTSAGVSRIGGSAGGFDSSDIAVFGASPDEYKKWLGGNQPPAFKGPQIGNATPEISRMPALQEESLTGKAGNRTPQTFEVTTAPAGSAMAALAQSQRDAGRAGLPPISPPAGATQGPIKRAALPGKSADDLAFVQQQYALTHKALPVTPKAGNATPKTFAPAPVARPTQKPARRPTPKPVPRAPLKGKAKDDTALAIARKKLPPIVAPYHDPGRIR